MGWHEYWEFLGCYCDLSQPAGLTRLEHYLSLMADSDQQRTPSNTARDSLDSDNAARQLDDEDMEDIFSGVSSAPKNKVETFTDNGLVSALAGLSLETTEDSEMSEEIVVDREETSSASTGDSQPEVVGGFTTPLRGTGHSIMAPSAAPLAKVYITGSVNLTHTHGSFIVDRLLSALTKYFGIQTTYYVGICNHLGKATYEYILCD